jgi:DNA-binding transcriptional ArsR family regulator
MKIADFTSSTRPPLTIRVGYSSAIDLLCALWVLTDRRHDEALADLELPDGWFDELAAELSPETVERLSLIDSGDVWVALIPTLPETGDGGDVASFIAHLTEMEPAELRYRIMNVHELFADAPRELVADAAEGVPGAIEEALDLPTFAKPHMKRWRETLRYLLHLEPNETKDLIVGVLEGTQRDAFASREAVFRPLLEADFRSKRTLSRRMSPERLVEIATSGINFSEEGAPRLPIVLMPTMVARPWVVFASSSEYFVLGYPVGDKFVGEDPDAPPTWLVKLHKALGDERRLRVLKSLAEGDASLGDLADKLDIPKSTLHHHLMLLRSAGLVRVHVGASKGYSLREESIKDGHISLEHYIHGTRDNEEAT